ncbi:SCO-spondin [Pelobates cultripes]|uniref:SCO-spondin n=1 Tax=Pelobates cultripes TaxID=61616 RepID=A0AAD1RUT0_PELCU|nr:SCO-spondin [Pelobates cultripes]
MLCPFHITPSPPCYIPSIFHPPPMLYPFHITPSPLCYIPSILHPHPHLISCILSLPYYTRTPCYILHHHPYVIYLPYYTITPMLYTFHITPSTPCYTLCYIPSILHHHPYVIYLPYYAINPMLYPVLYTFHITPSPHLISCILSLPYYTLTPCYISSILHHQPHVIYLPYYTINLMLYTFHIIPSPPFTILHSIPSILHPHHMLYTFHITPSPHVIYLPYYTLTPCYIPSILHHHPHVIYLPYYTITPMLYTFHITPSPPCYIPSILHHHRYVIYLPYYTITPMLYTFHITPSPHVISLPYYTITPMLYTFHITPSPPFNILHSIPSILHPHPMLYITPSPLCYIPSILHHHPYVIYLPYYAINPMLYPMLYTFHITPSPLCYIPSILRHQPHVIPCVIYLPYYTLTPFNILHSIPSILHHQPHVIYLPYYTINPMLYTFHIIPSPPFNILHSIPSILHLHHMLYTFHITPSPHVIYLPYYTITPMLYTFHITPSPPFNILHSIPSILHPNPLLYYTLTPMLHRVLDGNTDSNTPVRRELNRPLLTRFLRIVPVEYNKAIYLRSEILGCHYVEPTVSPLYESLKPVTQAATIVTLRGSSKPSHCRPGEFECHSGECLNASSTLCDGKNDCRDYSDEEGCGVALTSETVPDTVSSGGVLESTSHLPGTFRPGEIGEPGVHLLSQPTGSPGLLSEKPQHETTPDIESTGEPGIQEKHQVSGKPGIRVPERPEHRLEPEQSVTESTGLGKYSFGPIGPLSTESNRGVTLSPENRTPQVAAITSSQWKTPVGSPGVNTRTYPTGISDLATQFPGKHEWMLNTKPYVGASPPQAVPNLGIGKGESATGLVNTQTGDNGISTHRYASYHTKSSVHADESTTSSEPWLRTGHAGRTMIPSTQEKGWSTIITGESISQSRSEYPFIVNELIASEPPTRKPNLATSSSPGQWWSTSETVWTTSHIQTGVTVTNELYYGKGTQISLYATVKTAPWASEAPGVTLIKPEYIVVPQGHHASLKSAGGSVIHSKEPFEVPPEMGPDEEGYIRPGGREEHHATTKTEGSSKEISELPRRLCRLDQFACSVFGCVDGTFVCDGQKDCIDGSDELLCGTPSIYTIITFPTAHPRVPPGPSVCSSKQFTCSSGECFPLEKKCDLQKDCSDGSDEFNCVDCILSPWTFWSECSRSCGLGVTFRRRDVIRDRLPGGHCEGPQFDSKSCFVQACPVNGGWSTWGVWSPCDSECQGGVRFRKRSCEDPPPKNGGRSCQGESMQAEPCNLHPCGESQDCGPDMMYVESGACSLSQLDPCPLTCSGLNAEIMCNSSCMEGCRCLHGLYLQDGGCVNVTQCRCHTEKGSRLQGESFSNDNCSICQCKNGKVTCDDSNCVVHCGWSAWSQWTPCDQMCGAGIKERFRSPSNPPSANGGSPCEGDSREVQECYTPCANVITGGLWTQWTAWSTCSVTCFYDVEHIGIRRRFRHCSSTVSNLDSTCLGESVQEEPCDNQLCPDGYLEQHIDISHPFSICFPCFPCPYILHGWSLAERELFKFRVKNLCPLGMIHQTEDECRSGGGACPRLCLDQAAQVECASSCYEGCYCSEGLFLQNSSCVTQHECSCYHKGELYQPGETITLDACNNCTCVSGDMVCGTLPCPVDCGWSSWTTWSSCSRTCNVGTRRRYRSGTNPPAAFGGHPCEGSNVDIEFCSLEPCKGPPGEWGPWSDCSVPCGGGYRNRSLISVVLRRIEFSTCNLNPCSGEVPGVCPEGKVWKVCSEGPSSCATLETTNVTCQPGCYCQDGKVLLNNQCVLISDCPCTEDGAFYHPGETMSRDCNNWCECFSTTLTFFHFSLLSTCLSGEITNCTQLLCEGHVNGSWSEWTPWSECSAMCGGGFKNRYRFCSEPSGTGLPCEGPDREEFPCNLELCPEAGNWSEWGSWSVCTKSCGEGVRIRTRSCNNPSPLGDGDYCEGPKEDTEPCFLAKCPSVEASNCSAVPGSAFSTCGPSCPRSCDDITHCTWHCEPGCYCPVGQLLSSNGTECVHLQDCTCLDLLTGQRYQPGESVARGDGCNNCTCMNGSMICTSQLCAVPGGWCDWSDWTPCSRTCGVEMVTRYRSCSCPKPQEEGAQCEGVQQYYGNVGVQLERRQCPSTSFCPVDGAWGSWGPWSHCDVCAGESVRTRQCDSPPVRFGGIPCDGEARQTRVCHDNSTECSDCGGGQMYFECGRTCPRTCEDLQGNTVCLDNVQCLPSCGCPIGLFMQDGTCVESGECNCKFRRQSLEASDWRNQSSWSGPDRWLNVKPGEMVSSPCQNCSCVNGSLLCSVDPLCLLAGGWKLDPWSEWSPWSSCSVSCGGGEQIRVRECRREECNGKAIQSKSCNNQVCLDVGCPPDRLYRECGLGDGCPYSCAHLTNQVECFPEGCEEGCHCPVGTYFHNGSCVTDCPCVITEETIRGLKEHSSNSHVIPVLTTSHGFQITVGEETLPGEKIQHESMANVSGTCENGHINCTFASCPLDGGFSSWSPWSPCSVSCGGLGNTTRSRECSNPAPAKGGRTCEGPTTDIKYCLTPECIDVMGPSVEPPADGTEVNIKILGEQPCGPDSGGFGPWSQWTPCSKSCTDSEFPAVKTRSRFCQRGWNCTEESFQEQVCNLPQCTDNAPCEEEDCSLRNCTWNEWSEWSKCSRSCGVGQQRRLRTYNPPGEKGLWCEDILTGNVQRRFCNLEACKVDGSWSKWSPWSWCDRTCGGGKSVRSRTCTSPPPKNGGTDCIGGKYHVRICNSNPCAEGCPPGMEYVDCANRCPRHCSDFQHGFVCQDGEVCEAGCRCPAGLLEQDSVCVPISHCECTDIQGQSWTPRSAFQENCNNCSCEDGHLLCTNHTCPSVDCKWSQWSTWSPCSVTCGSGQQTRFRSSTSGSPSEDCQIPERQIRQCHEGVCLSLCPDNDFERHIGDVWLVGECQQCICTPEGNHCQDMECRVDGNWTPWSPWSECPVTCDAGVQIRTRACINPPPRNNGSDCDGAETETQECPNKPCAGSDLCDWSDWTPCSRTCGTGITSRIWRCDCPIPESPDLPCNTTEHVQTEACYTQPCKGSCTWGLWSEWSNCSCQSLVQQRHRELQTPSFEGDSCEPLGHDLRSCNLSDCSESSCQPPFLFKFCGSPCDSLCSSKWRPETCLDVSQCQPGCYCPEGTLEQNGECVRAQECGCLYISQSGNTGSLKTVYIPPGHTVHMGCRECICQQGELQCNRKKCQGEALLSDWSEWSPCSPCLSSQLLDLPLLHGTEHPPFSSVQQRHRVCLNAQTGFLWNGSPSACSGEVTQERLCPDKRICEDLCIWSEWGEWSACRAPCSGGFRVRWRHVHHPVGSRLCEGPRFQSESCNTAACPGEECEDRGKALKMSCANQCPRACADLWKHVECLQGQCRTGCRCPEGWLLQDRKCVPVSDCRCGLPTANAAIEYNPGDTVFVECNNCSCVNGTFICTQLACPSHGPWTDWGPCSASCGGGLRQRTRTCSQRSPNGAPCGNDTMEVEECNSEVCPADCVLSEWSEWTECSASCGGGVSERNRTIIVPADPGGKICTTPLVLHRSCNVHSCTPECPKGLVYSVCANSCPRFCTDLQPHTQCLGETCEPGCTCPPGMVLQDGNCVSPENCTCFLETSLYATWAGNLSLEERTREYTAGSMIYYQCNNCTCNMGAFSCTQEDCNVNCLWSQWTEWSPCSATCGSGVEVSQRYQIQHRLYEGKECTGSSNRQRTCTQADCSCPHGERWRRHTPEAGFCERTCEEIYDDPLSNCSVGGSEGCVCEAGRYRSSRGVCVPAAHCECEHDGHVYLPGTEWQDGCETCRCVNGLRVCSAGCPPLHCMEGAVKVLEPGDCCPVCRKVIPDESLCQLHTELRNITKGGCRLDQVEVSFCRGQCMSWTHVLPEEPYLQTVCDCCSYHLDPVSPVRIINLECTDGETEPVVLPVIHSCECSGCQGGDFSRR